MFSFAYRRLADGGQKIGAGLLTTAARLSADLAVLVHLSMLLALVDALLAGDSACLQHSLDGGEILSGTSAKDGAGGLTDISTVGLVRIQVRRSATMSSARQASAQAVQVWAHSKQAAMQSASFCTSRPVVSLGWVSIIEVM